MEGSEMVGMAAGFLTTASFVPQAWRAWRTRRVADLSTPMYSAMVSGQLLWLAYGLLLGSRPIVVYNAISVALACSILAAKIRFGSGGPPREESAT